MKKNSPNSSLIPLEFQELAKNLVEINNRFQDINQLAYLDNILIWAKREGRRNIPEIEEYLDSTVPFNKRGSISANNRKEIRALGLEEAKFGAIGLIPSILWSLTHRLQRSIIRKARRREEII